MTTEELFALLVLATVGSFTPGPNTALSTTLAANHGLRVALPFVCAVPCGWGLLLLACSGGLGALVQQFPAVRWGLLGFGGLYLLWLASRLARTTQLAAQQHQAVVVGFVQGVSLQFLNPKAWFLAISVTSGWVIGFGNTVARVIEVLPLFMFFGLSSNLTYACIGAALREWLQGPDGTARRLVAFNRVMALSLVATVLWMVRSTAGMGA
jgi:threonine/homoserine/homoserine lactone efflux protein